MRKQSQGVYGDLCKWAFYLGATQGAGSLACPAGLVADVALPQWHRCPPVLEGLYQKSLQDSSSCRWSPQPILKWLQCHQGALLMKGCFCSSSPPRPTYTVSTGLFNCQVLRTVVLPETGRTQRWKASRGQDPSRLKGSQQLSTSQQQHKPTTSHLAHARQRSAASLPFGSRFSISYLHTSLPSATPIRLIFPHKLYLPCPSNRFICSLQRQKLVTEIQSWPSHSREKQTTPCLVCRLSTYREMVFSCFPFQNHAIPAPYSTGDCNPTHLLPNCLFGVGRLFWSNLSKPMTVDTPGFLLSACQKLICCRIFLGPEDWASPGSSLPSHTGSAASVSSPASQELPSPTASHSSALAAAAIQPEVHLAPSSWVWNY